MRKAAMVLALVVMTASLSGCWWGPWRHGHDDHGGGGDHSHDDHRY